MRFSKYNQPAHHGGGRKPSPATIAKRQAAAEAEQQRQAAALEKFENAESGYFDGFEMVDAFHAKYSKWDALEALESDDCAEAVTSKGAKVHANGDGVKIYVMTEAARNGNSHKVVAFNWSCYIF